MKSILIQEHDLLSIERNAKYDDLQLVQWDKPTDYSPWGYYASYVIGAEWINEKESLVVTTKKEMEEIDFLSMFMACFKSDLSVESFAQIYTINTDLPTIHAPSLKSVLSPLIVLHFLGVVSRIRSLKKGYVHYTKNLRKKKGHILIIKNERKNIATKRFDRVYCDYDEYTIDTPENRLIKKALLFSKHILKSVIEHHDSGIQVKQMLSKSLAMFGNVRDDVQIKEVTQIKENKLFSEYTEAIRLAKLILKKYNFSISNIHKYDEHVLPFTLDMSLLYEHYVYGLLNEAYGHKITYQFKGKTGFPDFLYRSRDFKAILDTKYIPKYAKFSLDTYVIRQLSGYSRDLPILHHLGFDNIKEEDPVPNVPCIIIYPKEGTGMKNPFLQREMKDLCKNPVRKLSNFYKIIIPLPVIDTNA